MGKVELQGCFGIRWDVKGQTGACKYAQYDGDVVIAEADPAARHFIP